MQLSKLENKVYEALKTNKMAVFSVKDLCLLLRINRIKAYNLIKALKNKKVIKKVGGRFFSFCDADEFVIGQSIHSPSYVSFWSALNYYGFSDNMPKKIFFATTKYTKEINDFKYVTLNPKRFFGYTQIGELVIADKEKAVIDSLLLPKYAGGMKEVAKALKYGLNDIDTRKLLFPHASVLKLKDRKGNFGVLKNPKTRPALQRRVLDIKKLLEYAYRIKSKSVLRRLGFILDEAGCTNWSAKIKFNIDSGVILLDPNLNKLGNINKKWLLDVNW